jgi:hypothetical protein
MTMSSQHVERVAGQVSPGYAIFAAGALLSTSAILTTVVGLFALPRTN